MSYNTSMQNTNRNFIIIFAMALVVGAAAFLLYRSYAAPLIGGANQVATATTTGQTATTGAVNGASLEAISTAQDAVIKARAQKNAGDYKGAIATLTAALKITPGDVVAYYNLGDLYMNFAKDYVKAEAAYKAVIATDPHYLDAYRHLLELYTTTSYKPSNTAAVDVVAAALKANPNAYDLQLLLARWYRDTHNYAAAKAEYQLAIDNAKRQNLATVSVQIEAELKALPQ
jgi:tetratricopeptide (TPR) repeat protein